MPILDATATGRAFGLATSRTLAVGLLSGTDCIELGKRGSAALGAMACVYSKK